MNIAVLLESNYSGGGSFSHSINTCLDLIRYIGKNNNIVVYTSYKKNFEILNDQKIPVVFFSYTLLDKILIKFSKIKIFRFFFFNYQTTLENKLLNNNIEILYFPVLSDVVFSLKKIRFISTLLDLCHFQHSIFPEISKKDFHYRQNLYFYSLKKSLLVITSCKSLKKKISKYYNILLNKIIIIPYTPCYLFNENYKNKKFIFNLKKYRFLKNFFFYPAQIWGHKNHLVILEAAKILKKRGYNVNFVFSGRDRGYKQVLDNFITNNKLNNIYFTGYLTFQEMDYFYKKCKGIIFTSVFGPNAIPPLEAWTYKKPLIYNNRMEDDVTKNNALLVNVNNPLEVSNSIIKILNNKYKKNLIRNGSKKLKLIKNINKKCYFEFEKKLNKFFIKN
jgi:glycosyltransferase involved in cell wall biosynthesis